METKKLRKYFLKGTLGLCIAGIVISAISLFLLLLQFACDFDVITYSLLFLVIGPVLLVSTIKKNIKTLTLLSRLKRNHSFDDVNRSFCNTSENIYFTDSIIISDRYLFLKDSVCIIPLQEITKVYTKYVKNDKKEIVRVELYCATESKKKICVLDRVNSKGDLLLFANLIKQKNSNVEFAL